MTSAVDSAAAAGALPRAASKPGAPNVHGELRGSGLLLFGRFLAIGLNFLVQVLTVRYLARGDYGSFGFALSIVALGANFNLFGLARGMSRFAPLFGENDDPEELLGSIVVALGTICLLGALLVGFAFALDGHWQPVITQNPVSADLLLLLVVLTPLTALDSVLEVLAATFAGARAIFLRRHLLTPLLRLAAVLLVMALGMGPRALCVCYIAAAVVGAATYASILVKAFRRRGIALRWPRRRPTGPVLRYGASMLLVDLAGVSILHVPAVALEMSRGASAVAGLRAVVPLATITLVVFQSFKLLFVPMATRSFERGGRAALTEAYWSSMRWLGLLSFPVFAVCVFLSPYLVVALFGERYADAASLAAIMAVGYYLHAILGLNTLTLQALGDGRGLRLTAIAGIAVALLSNVLLVPPFGAIGAAIATTITLLAHDLTNLVLLVRSGRIGRPGPGFARPYAWLLVATGVMALTVTFGAPSAGAAFGIVGVVVAVTWWGTRESLDLLSAFPELGRFPVIRWIVS